MKLFRAQKDICVTTQTRKTCRLHLSYYKNNQKCSCCAFSINAYAMKMCNMFQVAIDWSFSAASILFISISKNNPI